MVGNQTVIFFKTVGLISSISTPGLAIKSKPYARVWRNNGWNALIGQSIKSRAFKLVGR